MNIKDIFNFQKKDTQTDYSVSLSFPLVYDGKNADFAHTFVLELYRRILTDCFNHSSEIPQDKQGALWDSVMCFGAEKGANGLISFLAEAITDRKPKLYLVFDNGFVRLATKEEEKDIDANPKKMGAVGLCFADFKQATILLVLASLMERLLENANAGLNISRSVLIQINQLRESVSLPNAEGAIAQAKAIEQGLKSGKGALLDAADKVEVPVFNTDPLESALEMLYGLMSFFTGMPRAYVSGELTAGLNATGEGDQQATEQGLKFYFVSIFKPVCEQLFGVKNLTFKTSEWRKFAEIANVLPVLEATDAIPAAVKERLVKEMFG